MKASIRYGGLVLAFVASVCFAQNITVATKAVGPAGAATQTANHASANIPTAVTDGVSIAGQTGARVILSAEPGRTLSGAGTLKVWLYDGTFGDAGQGWYLNQNVSFSVTGTSRQLVFEDLQILAGGHGQRMYVEAVSVTVSGGTTVSVLIQTWRK